MAALNHWQSSVTRIYTRWADPPLSMWKLLLLLLLLKLLKLLVSASLLLL